MATQAKGALARYQHAMDAAFGTGRGAVRALLAEIEYVAGRIEPFVSVDPTKVERMVFVCLGNINRSAFAEMVAQGLGARTASFGLSTTTGAPAFHKAIDTAPRFGVSLEAHRATDMSDYQYQQGDLLLAMEIRHARKLVMHGIAPGNIALLGHWGSPRRVHIHDPHVLSDRYFRTCFGILASAVGGLVDELRAGGSPCVAR